MSSIALRASWDSIGTDCWTDSRSRSIISTSGDAGEADTQPEVRRRVTAAERKREVLLRPFRKLRKDEESHICNISGTMVAYRTKHSCIQASPIKCSRPVKPYSNRWPAGLLVGAPEFSGSGGKQHSCGGTDDSNQYAAGSVKILHCAARVAGSCDSDVHWTCDVPESRTRQVSRRRPSASERSPARQSPAEGSSGSTAMTITDKMLQQVEHTRFRAAPRLVMTTCPGGVREGKSPLG